MSHANMQSRLIVDLSVKGKMKLLETRIGEVIFMTLGSLSRKGDACSEHEQSCARMFLATLFVLAPN